MNNTIEYEGSVEAPLRNISTFRPLEKTSQRKQNEVLGLTKQRWAGTFPRKLKDLSEVTYESKVTYLYKEMC